MSLAVDVLEVIRDLGSTGTLVKVTSVYDEADGKATETTESHAIECTDLVEEVSQFGTSQTDKRVTAHIYVSAEGLPAVPELADRVVYKSRTFTIGTVYSFSLEGAVAAYRMDLAEIGA